MVYSNVHVRISSVNGYGVTTLSDPETTKNYVTSVTVTDGVAAQPQGTVTIPLRNPSTNKPHKDLIKPGDLCLIEFLANTPEKKGWFTALHGPVRSVSERTMIGDDGSESVCVLTVGSMIDILAADAVAWWMYLFGLKGIDIVRASLTADETNTKPYAVAYNWLTKVAFDSSTYNPAGSLSTYCHLDFGGLEALTFGSYKLTMVEGPHLQIISQFLDAPFHELFATVGTSAEFQGDKTLAASAGGGGKQAGAGTILRWRAAPYPYCNVGGSPNRSEWDKLPLHKIGGPLQAVHERGSEYTLAPERNVFLTYPGYDQFEEVFSYTLGIPVVNLGSVRRLGYRPLKTQTSLLINNEVAKPDLLEFAKKLSWRLAGQWANASLWENGTVQLPLCPWIRSGDRVQALSPWQSQRTYQYHVAARQMNWSAASGGSMILNLERGFDTQGNPNAFAEGLTEMELGSGVITDKFRLHDKPGY